MNILSYISFVYFRWNTMEEIPLPDSEKQVIYLKQNKKQILFCLDPTDNWRAERIIKTNKNIGTWINKWHKCWWKTKYSNTITLIRSTTM